MADYAHEYTDHEIAKLNKQIQDVYKEAEKDIQQKMDDFNKKYEKKEKIQAKKVAEGKITQEEFDRWKKGQVFQGQQWQAKKEQILDTMHHSNEIATNMINDKTQNVFMTNANYMSYDMEHRAGINFGFGIYDSNTVSKLIKDDPQLLPKWKIDEPKDYKWSQKKLNNAITQGIIQGESLDKIANRISKNLSSQNKNKMKTFARTAMTRAQNAGRQMQLENAKKMGIDLMKEWMATLDSHTRDSHADVDGEQVEIDKKFSNGLSYPGEPGGAPAEVYNCRCTMVSELKKYPSKFERYDAIAGRRIDNMSYRDWEKAKRDEGEITGIKSVFSKQKMSNVYYEMRDTDKKLANQFYKELGNHGKPSEVWSNYLTGNLDDATTAKIDDILNNYAQQKGFSIPGTPDVKEMFANKKMSNVYNELKEKNVTLANQFYKDLGKMGKPSEVWNQYLAGTLDKNNAAKIEKYLSQHINENKPVITTIPKPKPEVKPKPEAKPIIEPEDKKSASKFDEKWLNRNIKNNKFNTATGFNEDVKKEMIKQLEKTPDAYKRSFVGTLKDIAGANYRDKNRSYYRNGDRAINIDFVGRMKDCKNYENPLHVWFHEMGHAIDYRARSGGGRFSASVDFKEAFKKDIALLNDKMSTSDGIKAMNALRYNDESRGLQNIFSSLKYINEKGEFKNKISKNVDQVRYNWSHSDEYWRRENNPAVDARSELFAHLSAAQCSKKQQEYMKEYFPNSWETFNELISNSKFNK